MRKEEVKLVVLVRSKLRDSRLVLAAPPTWRRNQIKAELFQFFVPVLNCVNLSKEANKSSKGGLLP